MAAAVAGSEGSAPPRGASSSRLSALSRVQGPIQAALRPGIWFPGMRRLRLAWQSWTLAQATPEEAFQILSMVAGEVCQEGLGGCKAQVRRSNAQSGTLSLALYTPVEWLDVMEFKVRPAHQGSGSSVYVRSFSSGFMPTSFPLGPLFSCLFFWFPFAGQNPEVGWTNSFYIAECLGRAQAHTEVAIDP